MGVTRTNLTAVGIGQNTPLWGVSKSYGAMALPFGDSLDITPNVSLKEVGSFGSQLPQLMFNVHEGATGKISYSEGNQGVYEALIMNRPEATEEILIQPDAYQPFHLMGKLKGVDKQDVGAFLALDCTLSGNAHTRPLKDMGKSSLDFKAKIYYETRGLGVLYTRARGATAMQGVPSLTNASCVASATGGYLSTGTYYFRITAVTATGESAGSNECAVETTAATDKVTVTTPAIGAPVTAYNIYVGNRSGATRYSAQCSSGTTTVITQLPSASSKPCPNVDSGTGVAQITGDKVFSGADVATIDIAAYKVPQTGLDYLAIIKNGLMVACPAQEATVGGFLFADDGLSFSLDTVPTAKDVWELFTCWQPT